MRTVTFSRDAAKMLLRIPANVARTIRSKIDQYAADPVSHANNVIAMKGYASRYRLRVGDWRVIFDEEGHVLLIIRIAPRGSAYD